MNQKQFELLAEIDKKMRYLLKDNKITNKEIDKITIKLNADNTSLDKYKNILKDINTIMQK